ncbi:MAG TPA: hypothetical protein VGC79_14250 [Polyangiaceae bacterium]
MNELTLTPKAVGAREVSIADRPCLRNIPLVYWISEDLRVVLASEQSFGRGGGSTARRAWPIFDG